MVFGYIEQRAISVYLITNVKLTLFFITNGLTFSSVVVMTILLNLVL